MSFFKKWFPSKENNPNIASHGIASQLSHKELLELVAAPESEKTAKELLKLGASSDSRIRKEQLVALAKFLLVSHTSTEQKQVLIGVSICPKCDKATTFTTTLNGKKDMPSLCLICKNIATAFTWWEAPILYK